MICLFLATLGLPRWHGLSLVAALGGYSLSWFMGSHCSIFSCCGAKTQEHGGFSSCSMRAQELWHPSFSCSVASGLFPDQGLNTVPCTDRRIPIYCTTREVQHCFSIPRKSHDGLKYFPLHLPSLTNPLSDLKKIFSRTILRFCFDFFLDEILWEKEIFSFFFLKESFLHENPLELKGQSLCRERSLLCSGHYGTSHSICMQKKKYIYIYIYI